MEILVSERHTKKIEELNERAKANAGNAVKTPTVCVCSGLGWVTGLFPVGDPNFCKAFPCVCKSNKTDYSKYLWEVSGLGETTFQRFNNYELRTDESKVAKDSAFSWASGEKSPWRVMLGNVGVGKTQLAKASVSWAMGSKEMVSSMT